MGNLVLGWIENVQGYFGLAVERCDRAVAIADASPGREVHRLVPHLFRAMTLINAGRTAEAAAGVRQGRRLAADLGAAWTAPFYHYADALAHWTDGQLDDLLVECEAGLRAAADHDAWLAAPWAYAVAAAAHLFQGRVEEAGRLLDEGEVRLGSSGAQFGIEWLVWIRGLQLEMAEGPEAAIPVLLAGWEAAQGLQAGAALSLFGPDLVRLLVAADRVEEAHAVLDALSAGASAGERFAVDVLVRRCQGLIDGDEAPIAEARAAHEAQGRRLEAALDDEARLLVRLRREAKAAAADVRAGAEEAEAAGFGLLAARLRSVAGLEPDRRAARPTHGWDALTPSEWKIARLVGEGRSNPEIAAELFLSRRTVESHLSRIYTKLTVVNRTELALQLRDRELA
jgi:DNA-binding NarL/FixJ family response regulator